MSSENPEKFSIEGFDYKKKIVKHHTAFASMVYLPADWVGKEVAVVLLGHVEESVTSS